MPRSRSLLLVATAATLLAPMALPLPVAAQTVVSAQAADLSPSLQRWRDLVTGAPAIDPAAADFQAALARLDASADAAVAAGFADVQGNDGDTVARYADRLQSAALAYATPGSRRHQDQATVQHVLTGLEWLRANRYKTGAAEPGNWWGWEIGAPDRLLDTLLLLGDAVPAQLRSDLLAAVAHFVPDPARRKVSGVPEVGANLVDKVSITVRRGLLAGDEAVLALGRDKLAPVFEYTTGGDGWYADGSLIQHFYFAYTGGYGNALIRGVAETLALLAGTPWATQSPNVTSWIFDGVEPLLFRGQLMAGVRGRGISRAADTDQAAARDLLASMAVLGAAATPADRARLAALVAEHAPHLTGEATPAQLALIKQFTAGVTPRGDVEFAKVYAGMDRFVRSDDRYALHVAARSNRVGAYESGNGENLKGWYTGEGMTLLYTAKGGYDGGFWPTVDPYRLPGVTNATEQTYPRTAKDTAWYGYRQADPHTGGVALGELAAYSMRVQAEPDRHTKRPIDLSARKSWFTVGDTVVALGADITATGVAAQTTVENRMNPGAVSSGDGWLHVEGSGGYLFPQGMPHTVRESRTGSWSQIGTGAADPLTRDYLTAWFDHGPDPKQAGYAYYVLPGASELQTRTAARTNRVKIADNSATVQSVVDERLTSLRLGATFWDCGATANTVRSYGPASVALAQNGANLEIAVADPTQSQDQLLIEVAREGREVVSADPRVRVLATSPTIKLLADTRGALGAGLKVALKVKPTAKPALSALDCAAAKRPVEADGYVRGGSYAAQNFTGQGLQVKHVNDSESFVRQTFLRFERPAGEVGLAKVWINGATADNDGTVTGYTLYEVPDTTWQEATLTWKNKPALGRVVGSVTISGRTNAWYSIDVTKHLRAGRPASFALAGPPVGNKTLASVFRDRESGATAPYLQVWDIPELPPDPPHQAATRHVDCQAPAGGDGSEAKPLNSLAAVNAREVGPGDVVKFKAGTVCTGRLEPLGSGTADKPVLFTSYGEGPKPILQGDGGTWTVHLVDNSHLTLEKLHITNPAAQQAQRTGVQYNSISAEPKAGIVLRDLEISDVAGWGNKTGANSSWYTYSAAISVQVLPEGVGGAIDGLRIEGNYLHDAGGGGIKISRIGNDYHRNVVIRANTIRSVGGDGIVVHASDKPLIEHNLFDDGGGGKYPYADGNFAGMWPINSVDPVFQYNEVTRQRPSIYDSTAWDCDGAIKGTCLYQYNYSHANGGGFYLGCQGCTEYPNFKATAILRHNIAQDDCRIKSNDGAPLWLINNTFYCASEPVDFAVPAASTKLVNNVIYAREGSLPSATYEANAYFGGIAAPAADARAVKADPLLEAPGTATGLGQALGYRLTEGSPLLGAGVRTEGLGERDYFGNPMAERVSIGAYSGPAVPKRVYEKLSDAYNLVGVSSDHNPNVGGLGRSRRSFSGQALEAEGLRPGGVLAAGGVEFTWHPAPYGTPDVVKAAGQQIKVSGSGSRLVFLGFATHGAQSGTGTIAYTDGSTAPFTLALPDYWSAGEGLVVQADYHNKPQTSYKDPLSGRSTESKTAIFTASVPLEPGKTVASVTLPAGTPLAEAGLHLFDLKIGG
ncbi:polysaccharide lyase family 8 super-sandwich domain-containing protein [Nonomuraea sp. NPDC050310]|uniref:polysaccharide lyase family 8 super-sandwich domain-containing protein n=1 Tax=Nonomuraea sp. NPDC050310 TaxID=3154935 RepID=UPI003408681E